MENCANSPTFKDLKFRNLSFNMPTQFLNIPHIDILSSSMLQQPNNRFICTFIANVLFRRFNFKI